MGKEQSPPTSIMEHISGAGFSSMKILTTKMCHWDILFLVVTLPFWKHSNWCVLSYEYALEPCALLILQASWFFKSDLFQSLKEKKNLPCSYIVLASQSTPYYHLAVDLLSGKWGKKKQMFVYASVLCLYLCSLWV